MSALGDTLRALADVLGASELSWFVFGAQAVAVRGAPRATQDVDGMISALRTQRDHPVHTLLRRMYRESQS